MNSEKPTEKKYLSIGEMAEINHTTVPTLRLYDECGLLTPIYVDPDSHYRYYDIKQNARLDMIQYMKALGMGLKEIREVFDKEDLNTIESILIRKKAQTQAGIAELKRQADALDRIISSIERYRKSPLPGTRTLEYIDARSIYAMHTGINFYEHDIDTYELILKQLKDDIISHDLPQIYYCNAGTILKMENFLNLNFVSDQIFVFVDRHFPMKEAVTVIDSGMYACIYLDDFDAEKEYAFKLLDFCRQQHYQVTGDYICEVLAEFFSDDSRRMFLRLQVPVGFK